MRYFFVSYALLRGNETGFYSRVVEGNGYPKQLTPTPKEINR